ncbi:hypothetical protein SCP_0604200 [Sparassis crispa]|uniref:Uncharacterized protein n=1 Tax=Sparassis crispa TaxID=139825 RepID=A0A401GQD0_9APHY|nr:hypothetical protein SCP_0604200 [Sparassis crispa]GBE84441.1 hypothetical protein SCP_0604200 [Sparassis crispa]
MMSANPNQLRMPSFLRDDCFSHGLSALFAEHCQDRTLFSTTIFSHSLTVVLSLSSTRGVVAFALEPRGLGLGNWILHLIFLDTLSLARSSFMPSTDHYPRLPPYNSRACFRYHPYPRVGRRYDLVERLVSADYEDDIGEIMNSSPPISLLPSSMISATSNDDVSTLELDGCAFRHEGSDVGRKQEKLRAARKWFTNVVLVVWRRCRTLPTVQSCLPAKAE